MFIFCVCSVKTILIRICFRTKHYPHPHYIKYDMPLLFHCLLIKWYFETFLFLYVHITVHPRKLSHIFFYKLFIFYFLKHYWMQYYCIAAVHFYLLSIIYQYYQTEEERDSNVSCHAVQLSSLCKVWNNWIKLTNYNEYNEFT